MARDLKRLNPHWGDETLFQEARHINAALIQVFLFLYLFIIYHLFTLIFPTADSQSWTCCSTSRSTNICRWSWANATCIATVRIFWEQCCQKKIIFLFSNPNLLGLVLYSDGYFDGYDPTVNPGAGIGCHKHSEQKIQTNIQTGIQNKQIFCVRGRLVGYSCLAQPYWFLYQAIITLFWQNQIGRSSFHDSCLQIRTLPSTVHHWTMVNKVLLLLINKTPNLF